MLQLHSVLYFNIIRTASIGSSAGPHTFPFPIIRHFAYLPRLLRNISNSPSA